MRHFALAASLCVAASGCGPKDGEPAAADTEIGPYAAVSPDKLCAGRPPSTLTLTLPAERYGASADTLSAQGLFVGGVSVDCQGPFGAWVQEQAVSLRKDGPLSSPVEGQAVNDGPYPTPWGTTVWTSIRHSDDLGSFEVRESSGGFENSTVRYEQRISTPQNISGAFRAIAWTNNVYALPSGEAMYLFLGGRAEGLLRLTDKAAEFREISALTTDRAADFGRPNHLSALEVSSLSAPNPVTKLLRSFDGGKTWTAPQQTALVARGGLAILSDGSSAGLDARGDFARHDGRVLRKGPFKRLASGVGVDGFPFVLLLGNSSVDFFSESGGYTVPSTNPVNVAMFKNAWLIREPNGVIRTGTLRE